LKTGVLLRRLQRGETLSLPASRPMPTIGRRCHELRIRDAQVTWRIIYRSDRDAIIIVEVFAKKTAATPKIVIESCQKRIRQYDEIVGGHKS
jgi:phage-related protein